MTFDDAAGGGNDGTDIVVGTYYKLGSEIFLVTNVDTGTNTMTVERNVQTVPCRPSVAQTFGDNVAGFRPVVFSATNNPNTDGEDYQIDSNRLKTGTAYLAGALGDMLEDVNRDEVDLADCTTVLATVNAEPGGDMLEVAQQADQAHAASQGAADADAVKATGTVIHLDGDGSDTTDGVAMSAVPAGGGGLADGLADGDFIKFDVDADQYAMITDASAADDLTVIRGGAAGVGHPFPTCKGAMTAAALPKDSDLKKVGGSLMAGRFANKPSVDISGASSGTKFFASPWGAGGNVTDFCYAASKRETTIATGAAAMTGSAQNSLVVTSIDKLGVVVGDYVQVTLAGTADPTVSREYMLVTKITASTQTLEVIRAVAPNCLPQRTKAGGSAAAAVAVAPWQAGAVVTLVTPVYNTVQLVDSVTKSADSSGARDSGSCAMDTVTMANANAAALADFELATINDNAHFLPAETTVAYDGRTLGTQFDFTVGGLSKLGSEYMLVTNDAKTDDASGTLTVVRGVNPPCLTSVVSAHVDDTKIYAIGSPGCHVFSDLRSTQLDGALALGATTLTVTANAGMSPGAYLFVRIDAS